VSFLFFGADIRRIGEIPTGLPSLVFPTFTAEQITEMFIDGLVLGVLGCIDSLLTAMISDSLTRQEHDSNKELIGQGIGNMVSGLFGGLPGAGATMGTVVNIQIGARSALSGITRALILLVVVLGAAELTAGIPLAVLAGIALNVGVNILDWSFLKRAHRVSMQTAIIMYGVMLLTVFVDLIVAVGVGVFIANILTIDRLSELQSRRVKAISDADDDIPLNDEERRLLDEANGRVLLFYLSGPMIFAVSRAVSRQHAMVEDNDVLVIDLTDVSLLDVTVSLAIENAIKDQLDVNSTVFVVCSEEHAKDLIERLEIDLLLPEDHVMNNRTEALRRAVALIDTTEEPPQQAPAGAAA
jgi:SulP family sulfate permease